MTPKITLFPNTKRWGCQLSYSWVVVFMSEWRAETHVNKHSTNIQHCHNGTPNKRIRIPHRNKVAIPTNTKQRKRLQRKWTKWILFLSLSKKMWLMLFFHCVKYRKVDDMLLISLFYLAFRIHAVRHNETPITFIVGLPPLRNNTQSKKSGLILGIYGSYSR